MARKSTHLLFVSVPLIAGALTLGLHSGWDRWVRPKAVFVYPTLIDLGSRDKSEIAVARFEIQNPGSSELVVDQFTTSCSCAGVEREVDGKYVRVSSVHIPPRGTAELLVRVGIGAPIGDNMSVEVFCHSNDPNRPLGRIIVSISLITGGICMSPRAIVLGSVPMGEQVRRFVDLYDVGFLGHRIARVRSAQPERFDVRLLALAPGEADKSNESERKLVARLEVTARTERPWQLDGDIEIYVTDEKRPPSRLSVTGEVVSAARCWPSLIVLPRRIGDQTMYNSEVLVQGREEKPLNVRLLSAPAGLRVDIRRVAGHEDRRMVFVEGKPVDVPSQTNSELRVRLGVRSGEHEEEIVDIPVTVTEFPS